MLQTITGQNEQTTVVFDQGEIREFVFNDDLTSAQMQEAANILAANVEMPVVNSYGVVEIIESNFNDSYADMQRELIQMFK